jgi:LAO/AO transport system kinase
MEKAMLAKKVYENAVHILTPASKSWTPPVLTCSALEKRGIDEAWKTVLNHRNIFNKSGELVKKRKEQEINWMWSLLDAGIKEYIFSMLSVKAAINEAKHALQEGKITPDSAASMILKNITKQI